MTRRVGLLLVAGLVCSFGAAVVWADDLATVEKQIAQAWDKHKSMSAKIALTTNMEAGGTLLEGKGEGTIEFVHKGNKLYLRQELKNTMPQPVGGGTKMEQNMLMVIDGEYAWTLSDAMGQKMAMKTTIDPRMTGEPKGLFAELRKDHELKLLPDETLDGKKMYVIEATSKEKTAGAASKALYYFDRDSGFLVKMAVQSLDGKPTMTTSYSDIKYDVDINPDRFVFKVPEGVEVHDMTKLEPAKTETPAKPEKPANP